MDIVRFLPTLVILLPIVVLLVVLVRTWLGANGREGGLRMIRRRVRCPEKDQEATVAFVVDEHGVARDVAHCTLVRPDEPVACGKECRSAGVAPFGTPARG